MFIINPKAISLFGKNTKIKNFPGGQGDETDDQDSDSGMPNEEDSGG